MRFFTITLLDVKSGEQVERMAEDRLRKRADACREEDMQEEKRRSRLRREDCVKRDVRNAGIEGNWGAVLLTR